MNLPSASFEKALERDSTFVTQGTWSRIMAGENYLNFGAGNPYPRSIALYATPENIQIWENPNAIGWFLDWLLEENKKGTGFMERIATDQRTVLAAIRPFWETGYLKDEKDVSAYRAIMERGLTNITLVYYAGMDERTLEVVQQVVREIRKDDEFFSRNDTFIIECVSKAGYDGRLAGVVLPEELSLLPDVETLKKRREGCVLVDGTELFVEPLETFAREHSEYVFADIEAGTKDVREVKGQIAQKGKVTGRVRVVKNREQAAQVEEGEIIVSPMTTPDFIAAMKKAAAFVTDEGGIVCHAAIVARELKKPCIIGTKIATKTFKDGDRVEVDANVGVVRKITEKI